MGRQRAIAEEDIKSKLIRKIDDLSSKKSAKYVVYASSLIFFFAFILIPPIAGILENLNKLGAIYYDPSLIANANLAIVNSFIMAFTVAALDLIAALPLAWFIVRSKMRLVNFIDALVNVPFLLPTTALGYSFLLFWSSRDGIPRIFGAESLVSPGFVLVLLLHFAFSYPVIVRVMVGELLTYREVYEVAARTLGAQPFTAVRTITLPLLKPGIIASFLLSFARSLSETGATVIVAGNFENGSVFIFKNMGKVGEGALVYVSSVLILTSTIIFFLIKLLAPKLKFPIKRASPPIERKLSSYGAVKFRDGAAILVFLVLVIAPSLFVALPVLNAFLDGTVNEMVAGSELWSTFWRSMLISYAVGSTSTLINIVFGLPAAILIARKKLGRATSIIKSLVSIPIIVPSIALGVSLKLFWGRYGFIPELWVIVLSHTTITYTYFVESMSAAIEGIPVEIEDVASTLGAKPFTIFRRITLPLTKYAVFSGAILTFTRALGETGAAKAVVRTKDLQTLPVLLVDWIVNKYATSSQSALGVGLYILSAFIMLLALRFIIRGRKR
jgi:thiamine transport system permease protein